MAPSRMTQPLSARPFMMASAVTLAPSWLAIICATGIASNAPAARVERIKRFIGRGRWVACRSGVRDRGNEIIADLEELFHVILAHRAAIRDVGKFRDGI